MTAEDIQKIIDVSQLLVGLIVPEAGLAAGLIDVAVREAGIAFNKGELTPEQVADVKARAQVADDAWDAAVAKAHATAGASGAVTDPNA